MTAHRLPLVQHGGACVLPPPPLHEGLKSCQISSYMRRHHADRISEMLHHALRVICQLQQDLGSVIRETMEGHDTPVDGAAATPPGDALVRCLLGDLRVPLLFLACDLGLPMD